MKRAQSKANSVQLAVMDVMASGVTRLCLRSSADCDADTSRARGIELVRFVEKLSIALYAGRLCTDTKEGFLTSFNPLRQELLSMQTVVEALGIAFHEYEQLVEEAANCGGRMATKASVLQGTRS